MDRQAETVFVNYVLHSKDGERKHIFCPTFYAKDHTPVAIVVDGHCESMRPDYEALGWTPQHFEDAYAYVLAEEIDFLRAQLGLPATEYEPLGD